MDTTIQFYDMYGHENGSVTIRANGTMVGSDENRQHFADDWRRSGGTTESFINRFSDWGNGYSASRRISPDPIDPPVAVEDQGPLK